MSAEDDDSQPPARVALRKQIDALTAENAALAAARAGGRTRTRRSPGMDVPRMLPSRRMFARIDRFEIECPHCGRLIFAAVDQKYLPKRLQDRTRARAAAKQRPMAESVLRMFWNPHTQRLECPWCDKVYTLGVVVYPVKDRGPRVTAAPDVVPTPAEVAEMRRLAGGWFVKRAKPNEEHANLLVTATCSCSHGGIDPACPLHGEAVTGASAGAPEEGESPSK